MIREAFDEWLRIYLALRYAAVGFALAVLATLFAEERV